MAKSSIYSELLSTNLELLFMNHPPSAELQELLRKNLFSVPSKRASDELICYLYSVIDEKKYNVKQIWFNMMLDKKIESTFYSQVHKFSKEISDEYPEENLPKVVKSFFLAPSGERYLQYLYKLTIIAMKNDLKEAGIAISPANRPKDEEELSKLETINDMLDHLLEAQTSSAEQSHAKNKKRERLLKSQIKKKRKVLMELTADLKLRMEKCSLPEHIKSLIFSGHGQKVIKEWSTELSQRCGKLEEDAEVIKNIKENISQLNKAITQKRNGTLGKCSSYLESTELTGLFPEGFLNNLLRQAEETLNTLHLEGPADLSPYIPDLQDLTKQFQELLDSATYCCQFIIQLHDETVIKMPQLEAVLFSNEQLEAKLMDEEATGYGQSLVNTLCESTPPEMLRNLRIAVLRSTPPIKNHETDSQNVSGTIGAIEEDITNVAEPGTPVVLDKNLLKPICFEHKCGGSTWKHVVLLSTLKKKRQQKEKSIVDIENGICSPESCSDTPLPQHKRTSNPVKSLNTLWAEDSENCRNNRLSKKTLHLEVSSDNESPEDSSTTVNSAINNPIQTECHLSGLLDSRLGSERLSHIFPGLIQPRSGMSDSEAVKHLIIQEQNKVSDHLSVRHRPSGRHSSEEESTQISEVFNSGNFSQEFHNFMQAVTNSNGSLMGASSVFENSSSPSPPSSNVTGIHMLDQTSLDFMHTPPNADTSLAHWDDQKELKRILSVAISPAGISPTEVRSSTPINNSSSSQRERNGHLKDKPLQPVAAVRAVSKIPRIKSLRELQLKDTRSTLLKEDLF